MCYCLCYCCVRRGGGFRGFSSRDHDRGRSGGGGGGGGGGSENMSNHLPSPQSNGMWHHLFTCNFITCNSVLI